MALPRRNAFLKYTKIGTIPVAVGTVRVNDVRMAMNKFGFESEPERPMMGTNVSKHPATK